LHQGHIGSSELAHLPRIPSNPSIQDTCSQHPSHVSDKASTLRIFDFHPPSAGLSARMSVSRQPLYNREKNEGWDQGISPNERLKEDRDLEEGWDIPLQDRMTWSGDPLGLVGNTDHNLPFGSVRLSWILHGCGCKYCAQQDAEKVGMQNITTG